MEPLKGVSKSWVKRRAEGNTDNISEALKMVWQRDGHRENMKLVYWNQNQAATKQAKDRMKATYAAMGPEKRSDRVKRAWETRRAKAKAKLLA